MFKKLFSKSKFHLDSTPMSPPWWCLRRLTSHFRTGGGVGTGARVQSAVPFLQPGARWPGCGDAGRYLTLLRPASRAFGTAEKRSYRVPSAWAAECAGSGVGCSLTPCSSLLLCHRRGRRSRAEPSPGLDCAERTLLLQPRLFWLASPPTQRRAVVCVSANERR